MVPWAGKNTKLINKGTFKYNLYGKRGGGGISKNVRLQIGRGGGVGGLKNCKKNMYFDHLLKFPCSLPEVPSFTQRSELMTALAGSDIRLQCEASGNPDPLYDWMREGREIQNRNRFIVQVSGPAW